MDSYEVADKVRKLFEDEKLWVDVEPNFKGLPAVDVYIRWGDWKHEHLRMKWLCEQHGGYVMSQRVVEEDGSDCYSAEYRIAFIDGYKEVLDEASDF